MTKNIEVFCKVLKEYLEPCGNYPPYPKLVWAIKEALGLTPFEASRLLGVLFLGEDSEPMGERRSLKTPPPLRRVK